MSQFSRFITHICTADQQEVDEVAGGAAQTQKGKGFFGWLLGGDTWAHIKEDISNLPSELYNMVSYAKSEFNTRRYIDEILSVKELVVYRTQRLEDGQTRTIEVNLEDMFRPIIRRMGLTDKTNPHHPATDEAIDTLQTINIDEVNQDRDDEDKIHECSICICELDKDTVKTDCGHYYHKGCIVPWIKIHNRCPVCSELVAKV